MSKLLTVFGATGNQGGSVINTILADPTLSKEFKLRGITRDPSKPAAKALEAKGVEVVKADLLDKVSVEKALQGSHSVFAVTNFWESGSKELEETQGRNIADVSKAVGVQHLIWSTLANVSKISNGKLPNVIHFDSKANVEDYIRSIGVPMTSFFAGWFMSNLHALEFLRPRKSEDGVYTISWPVPASTKFPFIAVADDTGKFVAATLRNRDELLGGSIYSASGWWSGEEIVEMIKEFSGQEVVYREVSMDEYKSENNLSEIVALEMYENFLFMRDYKYFGPDAEEGVAKANQLLTEKAMDLKDYIARQKW